MKNKTKFEVRIIDKQCKGCRLCVSACNESVIKMGIKPNEKGFITACISRSARCTGCLRCSSVCPDAAIEIYRIEETGQINKSD